MNKVNKIMEMSKAQEGENKKNKGFSLVELIVVIAIMAILIGIVGTQVLPYIEKAREAKDEQIISSFCTAALTAFSQNAGDLDSTKDYGIVSFAKDATAASKNLTADTEAPDSVVSTYKSLMSNYADISAVASAMESKVGKTVDSIHIVYDADAGKVEVTFMDATSNEILKSVEAK